MAYHYLLIEEHKKQVKMQETLDKRKKAASSPVHDELRSPPWDPALARTETRETSTTLGWKTWTRRSGVT